MFKRIIARVLLFGVPCTAAYLLNRPASPAATSKPPVVCVYPGERPGELRIRLAEKDCSERSNVSQDAQPDSPRTIPALQIYPEHDAPRDSSIRIPF